MKPANDLDPRLARSIERAVAQIPVPPRQAARLSVGARVGRALVTACLSLGVFVTVLLLGRGLIELRSATAERTPDGRPSSGLVPAEATPAPTPRVVPSEATPTPASQQPPTYLPDVTWTAPGPGSLYALGVTAQGVQLGLIDPRSGTVTELANFGPAIKLPLALSPSGDRLVVTLITLGRTPQRQTVRVLRTSDGALLWETDVHHLPYFPFNPHPVVAVSPDSRFLYLATNQTIRPGRDRWALTVLDFETGRVIADREPELPDCVAAQLLPGPGRLWVVCPNDLRRLPPAGGSVAQTVPIHGPHAVFGSVTRGDGRLLTVARRGRITALDGASGTRLGDASLPIGSNSGVLGSHSGIALSRDGAELFVLAGPNGGWVNGVGSLVLAVDTGTLTVRRSIQSPAELTAIILSADATKLYGLERYTRPGPPVEPPRLHSFDARTGQYLGAVSLQGPWWHIVAAR